MIQHRKVEDEIADRLVEAIRSVSDSVAEISEKLNVPRLNIYRYVAKKRKASLSFCRDFCECYSIDYEWLVTGKSNSNTIEYAALNEIEKTDLMKLVSENEATITKYLRCETDYHEPYVIKRFRQAKGISRKAMQRLLLNACSELAQRGC